MYACICTRLSVHHVCMHVAPRSGRPRPTVTLTVAAKGTRYVLKKPEPWLAPPSCSPTPVFPKSDPADHGPLSSMVYADIPCAGPMGMSTTEVLSMR